MENDVGITNCQLAKTLEQRRVVCYIGMKGHS